MIENTDALQFVPIEEWGDLAEAFLADWPRGIPGYNALMMQRKLEELGLGYGFKVYRPRGPINSGMVALNKKGTLNEIIIQCPTNDTSYLEESLKNTKLVDWTNRIMIPYMPDNIRQCVFKVAQEKQLVLEAEDTEPNEVYLLDNKHELYEDAGIPEDITFKPISEQHDINIVDNSWRNRYDGSIWFFSMLAKANSSYGIFRNQQLVSWVFINEVGALTHLFTLEDHRKKGYAEMLLKLLCNICLKENRHVFAYCRRGNTGACKLYEKLGFVKFHEVRWCFLTANL